MTSYLGDNLDILLGREFLTWLWYRGETSSGMFRFSGSKNDDDVFFVTLEQRLTVTGGEGDHKETASVSGSFSPLLEARAGLSAGKQVNRALIRFVRGELDWQMTLNAESLRINALKTPPQSKQEEDDDPDAFFLEKMYLIEQAMILFNETYKQFLNVRLSPKDWNLEVKNIQEWIRHDVSEGAFAPQE
ncbi:MAG: hypothetical protein J5855_00580 [Mailhella sp.]|nr:hypothetical protein [Mailhella sp.]